MCTPYQNIAQEMLQFLTGTIIGYICCINLYNKQGEYPNFAPTISSIGLINGHQYIGSYRIHHWMWGLGFLILSISSSQYLISGICFTFMIHGLSYDDCFEFC